MTDPHHIPLACPKCPTQKLRMCADQDPDCVHCDACGWCGRQPVYLPWQEPGVEPIDAADMWLDAHRTKSGGFAPVADGGFEELVRLAQAALMASPAAVTSATEHTLRELAHALGRAVSEYSDRVDLTDEQWEAWRPRWRAANQLTTRLTSVAVAIESIVRHVAS